MKNFGFFEVHRTFHVRDIGALNISNNISHDWVKIENILNLIHISHCWISNFWRDFSIQVFGAKSLLELSLKLFQ